MGCASTIVMSELSGDEAQETLAQWSVDSRELGAPLPGAGRAHTMRSKTSVLRRSEIKPAIAATKNGRSVWWVR
jgi:hypothetical protein